MDFTSSGVSKALGVIYGIICFVALCTTLCSGGVLFGHMAPGLTPEQQTKDKISDFARNLYLWVWLGAIVLVVLFPCMGWVKLCGPCGHG